MLFSLTITALDSVKFFGEVDSVSAPGVDGDVTILTGHIPLLTTLREGMIVARKGSEVVQELSVQKGTLEVSKQGVTILI